MKRDIPLAEGQSVAEALIDLLGAVCERIEVVGSVRRRKAIVHDVELLLEPKTEEHVVDLFGTTETVSLFEQRYERLVLNGAITPVIGGQRLKRFMFRGVQVELFIMLPPSQWGMGMVIRTGPADFSHQVVTTWQESFVDQSGKRRTGFLPVGMKVKDLGIHFWISNPNTGIGEYRDVIQTPTERDVFDVIGRPYLEPEARQ